MDPKQRVQILTLVAAARRIAARHFNERDADIAAMYWVGFQVSVLLKLPSPLIRLAIVLERDPYKLADSIGAKWTCLKKVDSTFRIIIDNIWRKKWTEKDIQKSLGVRL